ncbi:MAG: HNH endonuclease [Candidatus Devosia phytovorans]|uniref:HNH endonuclease n=1 Tax=Candidatus Devosia phytovorans TaxID=3121372 RepID=A0AAJ6B2Q7_9HYPH|nr:HNH endonuclease [Devosia sp.]WEK05723.1 MAG: HNH endonuclease [Devosia sp.]
MPRHNFSAKVKRQARERSCGFCEAVGAVYGLPVGQRCNASLDGKRVEIDHYPIPATDEGSDVLENAVACCVDCHRFKTSSYDVPMQAKGKRMSDRHQGIASPKSTLASQRLGAGNQQRTATRPIEKWSMLK